MPKVSQFQNKRKRPLRLFALQCVHIVKTDKNMERLFTPKVGFDQ